MILVLVCALALRLSYLWGQARNNPLFDDPFMDGLVHHEWARQIAAGEGLGPSPFFRAPLYYYLLGGLYWLGGASPALGRLAGSVLGALTCYLIGWLGARVAGFRAGLLAGLLAAVYWPFVYFDGELLTVGLEVFLNTAFLLVLIDAVRRRSLRLFLLAGIVYGLSAITRPNVLALAPGLGIWLWYAIAGRPRLKEWLRTVSVTAAGAALVVLPVAARNYLVGGEPVLIATNAGVNFYIGNNPDSNGYVAVVPGTRPGWWEGYEDTHRIAADALGYEPTEREVSKFWLDRAAAWIRSDPAAWLRLTLLKLRLFWTPLEIPNNQPILFFARMSGVSALFWVGFPVAACLGLAGFVLVRSFGREWALLVLYGVIYMGTVVAFFCPARYRLPVVPVLLVSAAAGLVGLIDRVRERRLARVTVYAAAVGLVAVVLPFNLPVGSERFDAIDRGLGHRLIAAHHFKRAGDDPRELDRAIEHLQLALEDRPTDTQARLVLARAFSRRARHDDALRVLREAVAIDPGSQDAATALATALGRRGSYAEAVEQYRRALRLGPASARTYWDFAFALGLTGSREEAIGVLQAGLAVEPGDHRLLLSLAWERATAPSDALRDGREAVALAERARAGSQRPSLELLDTLAAAYAEVGRFEDATRHARQAVELARRSGREAEARQLEARLFLYQKGAAFRQTAAGDGTQ